DARVAAFVSRLDYPKNPHWLLEVAQRMPALHVLLAGEGPDEENLRWQADARRMTSRFHVLGHRDPLPVYQAADALLLPSLREGFSLVCAEAMSVGVPVLRTRTAGTQELIRENVTGRSTDIEQASFVNGAVEFLSLPIETLRNMGADAARHVRGQFTYDRQLEQTLALYRMLATLPTT
ncbi:MAG: glycosyltransferase, partial [Tepidisphaeraceae bacterium]